MQASGRDGYCQGTGAEGGQRLATDHRSSAPATGSVGLRCHQCLQDRYSGMLPQHHRVLALDYGLRRIGVAVSDPTGTLASPVTTLKRRAGKRAPIARIVELAGELRVHGFVVGLPLEETGRENEWTAEAKDFGRRLGRRSGLPVHFVDERYSSLEAEARIRSIGLRRKAKEDKARIDAGAAAIFLQDWLDAGGRVGTGEEPDQGDGDDG